VPICYGKAEGTAPASGDAAKVRKDIAALRSQIDAVDPETRHAASLTARLAGLMGRSQDLAALEAEQRTEAARSLVAAATAGGLAAIAALESAVLPIRPELAEVLGRLRGDDPELLAVVAELIEGFPE
jgi:hypothetical protein